MTKPLATMLLEANFDTSQVGETLEWSFTRTDHNDHSITGQYAGGIYYTINEEVKIRITAGSWKPIKFFKVLDCTLITRPALIEIGHNKPFKYAPPSPFVENADIKVPGATVSLPGNQFKPCDIKPLETEYQRVALEWDKHLTVGTVPGRWEFSFVVTVEVEVDGTKVRRVFCFDPEGEVGTTVSPPK